MKMETDSTDSRTQFSLLMLLILDRLQNTESERVRRRKNLQLLSQIRIKPTIKLKQIFLPEEIIDNF